MSKKRNDGKQIDLYDTIVDEWTSDAVHFTSEKQKKLAHYLALGVKPRPAALRAGYSKRYANSGVYSLLKMNKKFCEKVSTVSKHLRESYPEFCENMLPEIAWIERKIVEKLADNPDELDAVKAKVMRDVKRTAGVLSDEHSKIQQFVRIDQLIHVQGILAEHQAPERIEAVTIEQEASEDTEDTQE
jgi:hypothetical protein